MSAVSGAGLMVLGINVVISGGGGGVGFSLDAGRRHASN